VVLFSGLFFRDRRDQLAAAPPIKLVPNDTIAQDLWLIVAADDGKELTSAGAGNPVDFDECGQIRPLTRKVRVNPEGTHIAYINAGDGDWRQLAVCDLATGETVFSEIEGQHVTNVVWNPTAFEVLFTTEVIEGAISNTRLNRARANTLTQISDSSAIPIRSTVLAIDWSNTGQIALVTRQAPLTLQVFDSINGEVSQYSFARRLAPLGFDNIGALAWSPSGTHVAFTTRFSSFDRPQTGLFIWNETALGFMIRPLTGDDTASTLETVRAETRLVWNDNTIIYTDNAGLHTVVDTSTWQRYKFTEVRGVLLDAGE